MGLLGSAEPLDGDDVVPLGRPKWKIAAGLGLAIYEHHTRAALSLAAAKFWSAQS